MHFYFQPAFAFALLLAFWAAPATRPLLAQSKPEVLTNDSIVQMVEAHLSPDIIIRAINGNPGNYAPGATNLIQLKRAGVPDKVIAAMQAKAAAGRSSQPSPLGMFLAPSIWSGHARRSRPQSPPPSSSVSNPQPHRIGIAIS